MKFENKKQKHIKEKNKALEAGLPPFSFIPHLRGYRTARNYLQSILQINAVFPRRFITENLFIRSRLFKIRFINPRSLNFFAAHIALVKVTGPGF